MKFFVEYRTLLTKIVIPYMLYVEQGIQRKLLFSVLNIPQGIKRSEVGANIGSTFAGRKMGNNQIMRSLQLERGSSQNYIQCAFFL